MTNTIKTIIFIVSLFVFIFFFMAINTIIPADILLDSPNAGVTAAILYAAGYIIVLYAQALMKYLYTRKHMNALNVMKVFPASAFEVRDRLIILVLPLLAVILPIVRSRVFTGESLRNLAYLAVLSVIIEILYRVNKSTLRAYIGDKGVAVNGIDFRLELSIPLSYSNAVGFYPYEKIENFLALHDRVIIYQTYDFGTITIKCSEEDSKQIKGLLLSKKIPERRY